MRVHVRLFAGTRDAVGAPAVDLQLPDEATAMDAFDRLARDHPRLVPYRDAALLAVDGRAAMRTTRLHDGAEVAIMPPVSGGAGLLTEAPLDPRAVEDSLARAGAGAVVTFTGIVRAASDGLRVDSLRFEAYAEMAERELARVRDEAIAKFALVDCAILHRVGVVAASDPIVCVAASARHRREAFDAVAWAMDELKSSVPIWKEERGEGRPRWVNDVRAEDA